MPVAAQVASGCVVVCLFHTLSCNSHRLRWSILCSACECARVRTQRPKRAATNDEVRLCIHGVTAEEWTDRHGVEPFAHPCFECGRMLMTTIPFVQGHVRGLQAPRCECGNQCTPYAIVLDAEATGPVRESVVDPTRTAERRSPGQVLPLPPRRCSFDAFGTHQERAAEDRTAPASAWDDARVVASHPGCDFGSPVGSYGRA